MSSVTLLIAVGFHPSSCGMLLKEVLKAFLQIPTGRTVAGII